MHDLKIKLTVEVCGLCKRALMRVHCLTIAKRLEKNPNTKLTGSSDFLEMHGKMCILTMELSWAQALILGSAVRSYMENVLRETSPEYKLGQDLVAALSDYSDSHMAASLETEKKPAPDEGMSQEAEEAQKFATRMAHKRDDILRHVFTGGAKSINIWGNVVTDTVIDPVVRPNPGSFLPKKNTRQNTEAEEPLYQAALREDARTRKPNYPKHLINAVGEVPRNIPVRGPANTVEDARKKGYIK